MTEKATLTKLRAAFGRLPESFDKQIGLRYVRDALQFVARSEPELQARVAEKARRAEQHLQRAKAR